MSTTHELAHLGQNRDARPQRHRTTMGGRRGGRRVGYRDRGAARDLLGRPFTDVTQRSASGRR